ncbi:MAG: dipeptidyl aminopeptidase/acylaminoacyl peptidase [Chitinophagales bacterium]|jgi:dipeptidyl aminopeptidase/acylaminoacyl peptidase
MDRSTDFCTTLTTRDGQILHVYLVTPKDVHKNTNGLVVLPNAGPHGMRDYPDYNTGIQLLANRGYNVLQINFRGATAMARTFTSWIQIWGKVMADTVIGATRWAGRRGICK